MVWLSSATANASRNCESSGSQKSTCMPEPARIVSRKRAWVYSPRVEAVHLRGGMVARGGIRWSDRREDFRTEVLGLMKAQMVKNAVIVPVGSKGGFVTKQLPAEGDRQAVMDEVVACYRVMMHGMLKCAACTGRLYVRFRGLSLSPQPM